MNNVFRNFYTCYMHDGLVEAVLVFKSDVPSLVPILLSEIKQIKSTSTLDEYAKKTYPNLFGLFESVNNLEEEIQKSL